jgi:hypothetical protein
MAIIFKTPAIEFPDYDSTHMLNISQFMLISNSTHPTPVFIQDIRTQNIRKTRCNENKMQNSKFFSNSLVFLHDEAVTTSLELRTITQVRFTRNLNLNL